MTKETLSILMAAIGLLLLHSPAFGAKPIQTAQHFIILDPGHGGHQNGLVTPSGLMEKNITLKLARKISQKLEARYNVQLTRTGDTYLSPRERVSTANEYQADLYISIHLHNSSTPAAFFYYFDLPDASPMTKNDPKTLWVLSSAPFKGKSRHAARSFSNRFSSGKPSLSTHVKQAPVILLEGSTMPAILIEPFSIFALPRHPSRTEIILEEYAQLTAESIDHYFDNQ